MDDALTSDNATTSEERFRAFALASSDVVYQMSADWREMRQLRATGFIADTLAPTGNWIEKYILPEDRPIVLREIRRAIENRTTFELEHRVLRIDGTVGWTFSRVVPILSSQGEIKEWVGAARDVTQSKRDEEKLARLNREAEAQRRLYETILSSTPDLVYVFDLNHRFTYANRALLTMWGKTYEDAIGKNCLELGYEPWHAAMHDREIDQVIATKKPIRGDVPFVGTNGRRMYDYIFVPVFGTNGEVEAVAGTTRDVTLRYEAEQNLRQANRDLEEFAYAATHDLQEPARTVRIHCELLAKRYGGQLGPEALQLLQFVGTGAKRMQGLVQDLFSFAQAGISPQVAELADSNHCLEAAVQNLDGSIQESGATVTFGSLPAVRIQPTQLQQVFQNLIGNALKFRQPDTPPVVDVSAQSENGFAHFVVADNGIGIQDEYREQIFGLFKRLRADEMYPGTGIGLALCRRIMERNDGRIWVESKLGQGSAFHFTLPL